MRSAPPCRSPHRPAVPAARAVLLRFYAASILSAAVCNGVSRMNFDVMPELRWQYGYFFTLGLMATLALVLMAVFRKLDWL